MTTCDAFLSTTGQQSSTVVISWSYVDDSDGTVIVPTSHSEKLYDTNDIQRVTTNTALTTSSSFTATQDTTGSVTGTVNKFYVSVTFDSAAVIGTWHIQTTYTHELVSRTRNICFTVLSAGASVSGDVIAGTVPVYAIAKDIENFLLLNNVTIDVNSSPTQDQIDDYIVQSEGEFEERSGTAYKPILVTQEMHDIQAWRGRHREIFQDSWFAVPRPFQLQHRPVLPFDSTRGHKLEIYEGSDGTFSVTNPEGVWHPEYLTERTQGRQADWWLDEDGGKVYIRKTFLFRRANALRATYEYGKPITTTTGPVTETATTIPVASTHRYQTRGIIRLEREYIMHTGKTATSFTGCTRGVRGTQADSHGSNSEVYEVPENIHRLIIKRAAALFLMNEQFISVSGDSVGGNVTNSEKVKQWNDEWERELTTTYQRWSLL